MDPMVIHSQIHESEIVNVILGEKAEVTMESFPEHTFEATVSRFSLTPLAPGVTEPSYYDIEFTIPNPDCVLKEGFKGEIALKVSRTAGSSSPKIVNPNGIDKMGDQPFFYIGKEETEIWIASPRDGKVVITALFWAGPSIPDNPRRRFLLSSPNCRERQLVLPRNGWCRITVPVSAGSNRITLRGLDEPTLTHLPNGDPRPFLIGVRELTVSAVN
jgi:hypothetical protein